MFFSGVFTRIALFSWYSVRTSPASSLLAWARSNCSLNGIQAPTSRGEKFSCVGVASPARAIIQVKRKPFFSTRLFQLWTAPLSKLGAFNGYIREDLCVYESLVRMGKRTFTEWTYAYCKRKATPRIHSSRRWIYLLWCLLARQRVCHRPRGVKPAKNLFFCLHSTSISTAPITFLPHPLILGRGGGEKPIKITILCLQICRSFSLMKDAWRLRSN